jgi:hypothetical protein
MPLREVVIQVSRDFKYVIREVKNDGKETTKRSSWGTEFKVKTENFDEFVRELKLKVITSLDLSPPAHRVDPTHEYGSAAAFDESQWDSAIAKAAANAGGRRRRNTKRRSSRRSRRSRRSHRNLPRV